MQEDIKELKQLNLSEKSFSKFTSQYRFELAFKSIVSFLNPSIGMLLASKLTHYWSQVYWGERITSDFKVTIDPSLPDTLTPFTVYPYYQKLSKTYEYQDGTRLGDPLLPAYIKSRCSENDLQKYTPQNLLEMAAVVGNGFMIQYLTDLQRGSDRAEVNSDNRVLENILKLNNKQLLKLIISVAEEQKKPFSDKELILASDLFKAKSLVALWVDEPWSGEKMIYGDYILNIAASAGNLDWIKKIIAKGLVPDQGTLKAAIKSGNRDLVAPLVAASFGHLNMSESQEILELDEKLSGPNITQYNLHQNLIISDELNPQEALNQAIRSGQLNLVIRILEGIKPNIDILRTAIVAGIQPIIEYLMTRLDFGFDELNLLTQINKACDEAYVPGRIVESLISQLSQGRFKTTKNKARLNSTATKLFNTTAQLRYMQVVKLMLEEKTRNYLSFNPSQKTLNFLARMGDESLVESLLVYQPNLQPTIETIQSAIQSSNRLLIKMLIESVMRNTDNDPLLIAKSIFQMAVQGYDLWLVQWLMAKERGENRLMPTKSMITYAESIEFPVPKMIAWLKEQLGYPLLFSFKLFSEILSFLPGIEQSKLAITSKEGKAFTIGYWQGQSALTIFSPPSTRSLNSSSLKDEGDFKPHR